MKLPIRLSLVCAGALALSACGSSGSPEEFRSLLTERGVQANHIKNVVEVDEGFATLVFVRRNCRLRLIWDGADKVEVTSLNGKALSEHQPFTGKEKPGYLGSFCDADS